MPKHKSNAFVLLSMGPVGLMNANAIFIDVVYQVN